MNDFAATLPSYFGLTGAKTVKERGYFVCKTAQGYFKIHKTRESHRDIRRRHAMLENLAGLGFPWTDRLVTSALGEPFVQLGRETYVMTRHVRGREINLDAREDVAQAVESLARFHMAARGAWDAPHTAPPLTDIFAKDDAFLEKTMGQAGKNAPMSDFDVLFLKNSRRYMEKTRLAQGLLAETAYGELYAAAGVQGTLCHNALKEENLITWDGVCYLTRFEDVTIDAQITDFAGFLHRYARRSRREMPLAALMEIYDKTFPLPHGAMAVLAAYLAYPWQFVKIARQYYSKKRGWTPAAMMGRMEALLAAQEGFDGYVGGV